jgi:hypothetical protein
MQQQALAMHSSRSSRLHMGPQHSLNRLLLQDTVSRAQPMQVTSSHNRHSSRLRSKGCMVARARTSSSSLLLQAISSQLLLPERTVPLGLLQAGMAPAQLLQQGGMGQPQHMEAQAQLPHLLLLAINSLQHSRSTAQHSRATAALRSITDLAQLLSSTAQARQRSSTVQALLLSRATAAQHSRDTAPQQGSTERPLRSKAMAPPRGLAQQVLRRPTRRHRMQTRTQGRQQVMRNVRRRSRSMVRTAAALRRMGLQQQARVVMAPLMVRQASTANRQVLVRVLVALLLLVQEATALQPGGTGPLLQLEQQGGTGNTALHLLRPRGSTELAQQAALGPGMVGRAQGLLLLGMVGLPVSTTCPSMVGLQVPLELLLVALA